ncbi:MAG TPA: SDR family oxidoreductase, partial [Saprospiraceae bacterium]|nr:SDR family oxidoreductase [Saprospiraceae bacterium]
VALDDLLKKIDYIIHCAAKVDFNAGNFKNLIKTNVEGTHNLVNASLTNSIKKFVHISSVATLSKSDEHEIYDEKSKWNHSNFNSDYAISKYLSEQEVWRGINEGLCATILNPSLILGIGNFSKTSLQMIDKIFQSQGYHPHGGNGFVDVNDVAKLAIISLDASFSGERYIVSGENLSYKNLYEKILNHPLSQFKGVIRPLPSLLNKILLGASRSLEVIFRKSIILSYQSIRNMNSFPKYINQKSKTDFSFDYTPIDTTINQMLEGYFQFKRNQ